MYENTHILTVGKLPALLTKFISGVFDVIDLTPSITHVNKSTVKINTELVKSLIKPGDKYLAVGKETWQPISESIHLGPRGEGFQDCVIASYLRTHDDTIFKFVYESDEDLGVEQTDWIRSKSEYEIVKKANIGMPGHSFRDGISKKTNKPYYVHTYMNMNPDIRDFLFSDTYIKDYPKIKYSKIIRSTTDIENSFSYFMRQEKTETFLPRFGLDYETNGFPFDKPDFMTMGVGISDVKGIAAYYDMEWMRSVGGNYDIFLKYYKEFLDKYEEEIYVYNISFEQRVTYLIFNKLYFFSEAATINKVDSVIYPRAKTIIYKNMSLKWTAMRCLYVPSWDDDFDYLTDRVADMMREYTLDNYKTSDIWLEIMSKYGSEESEFDRLLNNYWGNAFACIPSNILGKYCNLDSYHTVLLRLVSLAKYSNMKRLEATYRKLHRLKPEDPVTREQAESMDPWKMFNDNMRLGALLNIHGASIDTKERDRLSVIASTVIAVSRINITKLYLFNELEHIATEDLLGIPVFNQLLRFDNLALTGDNKFDFKPMIKKYLHETMDFNDNYYAQVPESVRGVIDNLIEKLLDGVITPSIVRKKSFFTILSDTLSSIWNVKLNEDSCSFDIDGVHYEFTKPITELMKNSDLRSKFNYLDYLSKTVDVQHPQFEFTDMNGATIGVNEIPKYCNEIINVDSMLDAPYTRIATLDQFYPVFIWLVNKGFEDGDQFKVVTKELFNKVITEEDIKDIDLQSLAEKDRNVKVFELLRSMSKQIVDKYLDQMKGDGVDEKYRLFCHRDDSLGDKAAYEEGVRKCQEAYKRYLIDHNDMRFVRSVVQAEMFDFNSKTESDDDKGEENFFMSSDEDSEGDDEFESGSEGGDAAVEEMIHLFAGINGKMNKASKSLTKYAKPSEVAAWLDMIASMTNMKQEDYFETFNKRFFTKYVASEEDEMAFYEAFHGIDICSKTVGAFCKQCLCYSAAKKYTKVLSTYIDGQFTKYNKFVNQNDDNLISTERYHKEGEPGVIQKMYSHMNICEKQSKRWSGSMHTVPSKSETKRICNSPEGYLMSYFKQYWSSKTRLIAGKSLVG